MNNPVQYAQELLQRRKLRSDLTEWSKYRRAKYGETPVAHHLLVLDLIQKAIDGKLVQPKTGRPCKNLMVLMPPGAAKSTYLSKDTPPWFLQRKPGSRILACSYAADLIEQFSRDCRNTVQEEFKTLGYSLKTDSRAIQEWSTTNGGTYRCLGVGAGISGYRGDLGYIDDYIGTEQDADSKLLRDNQWIWYNGDFWPRMKPEAVQIIIANRRNEDDLVGRLIEREEDSWVIVKIPFFAKENDPLGRKALPKSSIAHIDLTSISAEKLVEIPEVQEYLDTRLWPEYFTRTQAAKVLLLPARTQSGLYGQEPAPEDGNYFKADMLLTYTSEERDILERKISEGSARVYGAGDWAVSEEKDANRNCFGCVAVDENKVVYILPDIFWKVSGPKETCQQFVNLQKRRNPLIFWSENGHISKSWGPFVKDMMIEQDTYGVIEEVTVSKAKDVRARSIQGMMSLGRVKFPMFASWWPDARHEMLTFPGGKADDFVDFISHIGMGLQRIVRGSRPAKVMDEDLNQPFKFTLAGIKLADKTRRNASLPRYEGR